LKFWASFNSYFELFKLERVAASKILISESLSLMVFFLFNPFWFYSLCSAIKFFWSSISFAVFYIDCCCIQFDCFFLLILKTYSRILLKIKVPIIKTTIPATRNKGFYLNVQTFDLICRFIFRGVDGATNDLICGGVENNVFFNPSTDPAVFHLPCLHTKRK
jgi:hypothetical protein